MRVTQVTIKAAFSRWCKAMGVRLAKTYNDVGAYAYDYNPTYGGYSIYKILNKGGGISSIMRRMPPGEFVDAMNFAVNSKELKGRK